MAKQMKGVYENPPQSGIWWILYYVEGKRHREKVGRRSDAVALYQRRKTDARMGIKMPEIRPRRAVLFEEIAADALVYSKEHKASYRGDRATVVKLLPVFGKTPINEITPQTIKAYLDMPLVPPMITTFLPSYRFIPILLVNGCCSFCRRDSKLGKWQCCFASSDAPISAPSGR